MSLTILILLHFLNINWDAALKWQYLKELCHLSCGPLWTLVKIKATIYVQYSLKSTQKQKSTNNKVRNLDLIWGQQMPRNLDLIWGQQMPRVI